MQPFNTRRPQAGPPPRRTAAFLALAAVAGLGLVAAGCGSSPATPRVAQVGTTTTSSSQGGDSTTGTGSTKNPAAFSACMRSHGVPNFPDPDSHGGISITAGPGGLNPDSPKFQAAQKACEKLMPQSNASPAQQAKAQEQMLKFSACMRSHGLAKFPDPQFSNGRGSLKLDQSSGLNPNSAQFKAAQQACQKVLPGRPTGGSGGTTGTGSSGGGPSGGATLQVHKP